jgi:hypothetical protein
MGEETLRKVFATCDLHATIHSTQVMGLHVALSQKPSDVGFGVDCGERGPISIIGSYKNSYAVRP